MFYYKKFFSKMDLRQFQQHFRECPWDVVLFSPFHILVFKKLQDLDNVKKPKNGV